MSESIDPRKPCPVPECGGSFNDLGHNEYQCSKCGNRTIWLPEFTLAQLRAAFHKWLVYSDETLLDLCIAIRCYTEWLGEQEVYPIWLAVLGASGNRKTETVSAFDDDDSVIRVENFTEHTFVSGNPKYSKHDLAPQLKGKLMLTLDFSMLLSHHDQSLNSILSILREGYDGDFYRRTGMGVNKAYSGIFFNWILCSTSIYDRSELVRSLIGQREFIYRLEYETPSSSEEREEKIIENAKHLEEMREELHSAVQKYLQWWRRQGKHYNDIVLTPETEKIVSIIANFIVNLRACAPIDTYKGEPTDFVEPEEVTRILGQLSSLVKVLVTLDPEYGEERALEVVKEIAKSSLNRVRFRVFKEVNEYPKITLTKLARKLHVSLDVIKAELLILAQLGFIEYEGGLGETREWFVPEDLDDKKKAVIDFVFPKPEKVIPISELLPHEPKPEESSNAN